MKQQISIQILRGIAATGVVLFHFSFYFWPGTVAGTPNPFRAGSSGVDIFFVLSGFVMWHTTSRQHVIPQDFWRARLIRIAPLYHLYTLAFAALVYVHEGYAFPLDEILQSLLFIPFTNSRDHQPVPILGAGWTLNYEALFYLLFGCSLIVGSNRRRFAAVALPLLGLICLRPFVADAGALALRFTSPLLIEFILGMAIASQLPRIQRLPLTWAGGLLAVATSLLLTGHSLWPYAPRTLAAGLPGALLVASTLAFEPWLRQQRWVQPWRALGDASYSVYLVHGLISACIGWYAPSSWVSLAWMPVWVAAALAAGLLSYRWIERPMLHFLRPHVGLSPTK